MERRERYVVDDDDAARVCTAVFDLLDADVITAKVDAYSDFNDQMPPDILAAQAWLRGRGLDATQTDPGASVAITTTDSIGWAIVQAFAPWSTRTALYDAAGANRATIEDGGHAVTIDLSTSEVAALRELLSDEATVSRVLD